MCAPYQKILLYILQSRYLLFSFVCIKINSTKRQYCEETKISVEPKLDTIGTDETIVQTR